MSASFFSDFNQSSNLSPFNTPESSMARWKFAIIVFCPFFIINSNGTCPTTSLVLSNKACTALFNCSVSVYVFAFLKGKIDNGSFKNPFVGSLSARKLASLSIFCIVWMPFTVSNLSNSNVSSMSLSL